MQPSDFLDIRNGVQMSVVNYYKSLGREARYFLETKNEEWDWTFLHFLIDKRWVIRYGFGIDRNILRGGVEIGMGPHYFDAAAFWSYEDSERFTGSVDDQSIRHNLQLLDEFWKKHYAESVR